MPIHLVRLHFACSTANNDINVLRFANYRLFEVDLALRDQGDKGLTSLPVSPKNKFVLEADQCTNALASSNGHLRVLG